MPPEPSPPLAPAPPVPQGAWRREAVSEPSPRPVPVAGATEGVAPEVRSNRRPVRAPRRGRRVKRIVRRVELWSVLKVALIFFSCMYVVGLLTMAVLWGFAHSAGLVDNFESFANEVGWENWQFDGEEMFRQVAVIGGVLLVAATLMTVLAAALLNVISELTGGIRLVVIEEDVSAAPVAAPSPGPAPDPFERRRPRRGRRG